MPYCIFKKSVLALAAHLENQGVHCSVIYGSLPPATRREQVRRFLEKETEVVVSTDAIGMGLNLPIRRIVFIETRKFDGVGRRSLLPRRSSRSQAAQDVSDCMTKALWLFWMIWN